MNIDHKRLCDVALRCGVSMEVLPTPGTFLAPGTPVASVWGDHLPVEKDILRALDTNTERTMQHDPAFGVRQLVDVAVRALSPSLNDPSTASQALDGLHDILARMLTRETSPDQVLSEDPVVILHRPSWDQVLDLAIHEIRHYGADAPQIQRRLQLLLEDLLVRADPVRREAVRRHLLEHATA